MPGRILVDITPLRESRDFRLLFIGQLISTLGTQLTVVAIPYQVYKLTDSSLQVGAISLAQLIPLHRGALPPGRSATRSTAARIMLWTTFAMVCTSTILAVNASVQHPSLVALYVVSSVAAGFTGFSTTARTASVPGAGRAAPYSGRLRLLQIILQVGHRRRPGARRASCSASASPWSTRSTPPPSWWPWSPPS